VTNILLAAGVKNIIGCDRAGAIYRGRREHMSPVKEEYARQTNPAREKGSIAAVLKGADVFIGVSAPGIVTPDDIKKMTAQAIVFALANPVPEVMPEDIASYVAVTATGRSDYPNQINNVLCFPGIFRGALDCRAKDINEEMKLAAAQAIAGAVKKDDLGPEYIIPSVFDPGVAGKVAEAAIIAARKTGVARKK
jgi:malate dehydrogenase (oxaloacetate-decarboxylating)